MPSQPGVSMARYCGFDQRVEHGERRVAIRGASFRSPVPGGQIQQSAGGDGGGRGFLLCAAWRRQRQVRVEVPIRHLVGGQVRRASTRRSASTPSGTRRRRSARTSCCSRRATRPIRAPRHSRPAGPGAWTAAGTGRSAGRRSLRGRSNRPGAPGIARRAAVGHGHPRQVLVECLVGHVLDQRHVHHDVDEQRSGATKLHRYCPRG